MFGRGGGIYSLVARIGAAIQMILNHGHGIALNSSSIACIRSSVNAFDTMQPSVG